jgi:hypothetical protein
MSTTCGIGKDNSRSTKIFVTEGLTFGKKNEFYENYI